MKQALKHYKISWQIIEKLLHSPPSAFAQFIEKPLYKHILSPSHGMIEATDKTLTLGQHVKAGDNLYKVSDVSSYQVTVEVPDKLSQYLQTGQPLLVRDYHQKDQLFAKHF